MNNIFFQSWGSGLKSLKVINEMGFEVPTTIQEKCVPAIQSEVCFVVLFASYFDACTT